MNKATVALVALMLSLSTFAQDFLQQWRDSAIKGMNEFRAVHWPAIKDGGWQFVDGVVSSDGIPMSDLFIKDVKAQAGPVRSAYVLNVFYAPVAASEVPEYQSTKALVWFNCNDGTYQDRRVQRYASIDGRGDANSGDAEKPNSAPAEMKSAEPQSSEKTLLAAVCSVKL